MSKRNTGKAWFELLSSMRFAISLLTILAIASAIGTVLKQNEPYNNYLNQFGPFWFPVFGKLGLYSVYHAGWFLLILTFLVVSTSLCIVRQAPQMLREMRGFREHAKEASLRQFSHRASFTLRDPATAQREALGYLAQQGYQARVVPREDGTLIAAKRGSMHRLGYLLAHGAIVLICVGGLLDGDLPLKLQMMLGQKTAAQPGVRLTQVPLESRLPKDHWSFRGNMPIPEGQSMDVAILSVGDGILVQDLPFAVSLKKFHIEHYPTGQPKRFASDVVVTDLASGKSFEDTIEVNKPLLYKGFAVYQASFEDGGSKLDINARSLIPGSHDSLPIKGRIDDAVRLTHPQYRYTVEFVDFRPINVEDLSSSSDSAPHKDRFAGVLGSGGRSSSRRDLHNVGPSFQFKLRDASGQAREYNNYMLPIEIDGRRYLMSGMREQPSDPFRYLRIPVDEQGSAETYFALRSLLLDPKEHAAIARRFVAAAMRGDAVSETMRSKLAESAEKTLMLFSDHGLESVAKFLESSLPAAEQEQAAEVFLKILQGCVWEAWQMARERGGQPALDMSAQRADFVRDAVNSISDSFFYGSPIYLQLTSFEEVKASVLQVTRSPGQPVVYVGCALLVLGVFFMLYVRERRLFLLIKNSGEALFAMSANRKTLDMEETFARQRDEMAQRIGAPSQQP